MKANTGSRVRFACRGGLWLSLLLWSASCNQSAPENALANWKSFSPPGGKFTVMMPPNPVEDPPKGQTGYEARTFRIVSAMSNLAGLAVGYSDQPPKGGFQTDPDKILGAVLTNSVDHLGGELLSQKPINLNAYPGREFLVSVKGGFTVRQRIYLANKRLYSIMIVAGSKGLGSPEAAAFFDSFQILK